MASIVDESVQSSIAGGMSKEAAAASDSRVRAWDLLAIGVSGMWQVALTSPTVFAAQGVRMLNGTPTMAPGNAPNANTPGA